MVIIISVKLSVAQMQAWFAELEEFLFLGLSTVAERLAILHGDGRF
jgi:hypothetical protein